MSYRPHVTFVCAALGALGIALMACGGVADGTTPVPPGEVTSPSGAKVTAAIAAVSLGDGPYQPSNVQIAFKAEAAPTSARVEIVAVTLVDASGNRVDTPMASKPQVWNGGSYVPWDQRVTPRGDLKASYELTTPAWGNTPNGAAQLGNAYRKMYRLRVTLRVDGAEVLLESADLVRDAPAVT